MEVAINNPYRSFVESSADIDDSADDNISSLRFESQRSDSSFTITNDSSMNIVTTEQAF